MALTNASKFSPQVCAKLLGAVRERSSREGACGLAGITTDTLRNWLKAADAGDEIYIAFAIEFRSEESTAEKSLLDEMFAGARSDNPTLAKACQWYMERRFKRSWTMMQQVEHSGQIDTAITHATPEQAANAIRAAFGQHAAVQADPAPSDD